MIAYMAHPVGKIPDIRTQNIALAKLWLAWLVKNTRWAVCVPWLPYVEALDEGPWRERGIADDLECLDRCDLVVLVGATISPGMQGEAYRARDLGIPVVDISGHMSPPTDEGSSSALRAVAQMRLHNAIAARPRRVWLPPMSREDLDSVRAMRLALTLERSLPEAREFLTRLIAAAESLR